MKKLLVFFFFISWLFLAAPAQAQPQSCSADKPYEIIPSCVQCGDVLFCYGNNYRLCQTDPKIPLPAPGSRNESWWFAPDQFPNGTILYNGENFPVPSGGVYVCDANVFGCKNPRCEEGGLGSEGCLELGGPFPISEFKCGDSKEARNSRPDACELCNQTGCFCDACATDFQINDRVYYQRRETEETACLEKPWGGTITIDPSGITIPFVGHKGGENEQKYLADYFEGTNEYYKNYGRYWLDWVNYAGVFRKLSPMTYQNQVKKQMVDRAVVSKDNPGQEGSIHDYKLKYETRVCWDLPFEFDVLLAILNRLKIDIPIIPEEYVIKMLRENSHACVYDSVLAWTINQWLNLYNASPFNPFKIHHYYQTSETANLSALNGNFPPNPDEENYEQKWRDWKNSNWSKLWIVVPMFSREDTPGQIMPYVGTKPEDTYKTEGLIEKVPHVARLHEASREIQQMLTPLRSETTLSQKNTQLIIAQPASENNLLCTQDDPLPVPVCNPLSITDSNENDSLCCEQKINVNLAALERFQNPYGGWPECRNLGSCELGSWLTEIDSNPCPGLNFGECLLKRECDWSGASCVLNWQYVPKENNPCPGLNQADCALQTAMCTWNDDCNQWEYQEVNRKVGISLRHPYLNTIWNQTTNVDTQGLFNIFRPGLIPPFVDWEARSSELINYSYSPEYPREWPTEGYRGSVDRSDGNFYFNHLGGVQMAKNWTVRTFFPSTALAPLLPSLGPITLDYVIDYRNPNITISEEIKADVIRRVKSSWPRSKIEENWDLVYQEAVSHGFNPAFVIAIWIEESGASGLSNTWDLGCGFGEQNNLGDQLDCFFNRFEWSTKENVSFEEFMCYYGPGHYPCEFSSHPNFPRNVKYWYDLLTRPNL